MIRLATKDVAAIVAATFPDYRRKTVLVHATDSCSIYGLNWDGGSRNQYRACTLDGSPRENWDHFAAMFPGDPRQPKPGDTAPVDRGVCIVRGGTSCGKPALLHLHIHPNDAGPYLTKGVAV